jgi:hypothetical protein
MRIGARSMVWMLAAALAFMAVDASAQMRSGGRGGKGGGASGSSSGGDMMAKRPMSEESLADLVAYRLELLQEDLRLTVQQDAAWLRFSEKMAAAAADITRERDRSRGVSTNDGLQQAAHAVDAARNRLTAFEEVAEATKTLYERLTPDQRSLASSRLATLFPLLTNGGQVQARVNPSGERAGP